MSRTVRAAKAVATGVQRFDDVPIADAQTVGSAPTFSGLAVCSEQGLGIINKTVITYTAAVWTGVDNAGVTGWAGHKIYDFPKGQILMLGAVADLALGKTSAGINDDWDGDVAIGTIVCDATATPMNTTQQDIIPNTATPQAAAGVTTADAASTTSENVVFDGRTTAIDAFLNFLIDDADHDIAGTAANLTVTGTVTLHWILLGDS